MALYEGLQQATDQWFKENGNMVWDQVMGALPTLSVLAGIDRLALANAKPATRFTKDSISSLNDRFTMRTAVPLGYGINALTGPLEDLRQPYRQERTTVTLSAFPSWYENNEAVRVADLRAYTAQSAPPIADVIGDTVTGLIDGLMQKINQDLFPATDNVYPSDSTGIAHGGAAAEDRVMAFVHPLQTGQSGNAAGSSTSYTYWGYDIGTNANSQAVNWGTHSGPTTLDFAGVRTNIIQPLVRRGSKVDLAIVGSDYWNALADFMEDKIVLANAQQLEFGATTILVNVGGRVVRFVEEPALQDLNNAGHKDEAFFLDSSTWSFGMEDAFGGSGTTASAFKVKEPDDASTFFNMIGHVLCRLICKSPRLNGRNYNANI